MIVIPGIAMVIYIVCTMAMHLLALFRIENQQERLDHLTDTCRERDRDLKQRVKRLENWRRSIVLAAEARHERREQP